MIDRQRLRDEATRVHLRYSVEVVEALGICPWASAARAAGRVHWLVSFCERADQQLVDEALRALDTLEANAELEIGLLVFPLLGSDRLAFTHAVAQVRQADAARKAIGQTVFAMAEFHPHAELDLRSPERLVPFVRRSPDPTIQLVRRSALHAVRMSDDQGTSFVDLGKLSMQELVAGASEPAPPPLAARVAKNNLRTLERLGAAQVTALIEEILTDRDVSYAGCGVSHAWGRLSMESAR